MPSRYEISAVISGENRASAAFNEAQTDARQLSATLDALDNKRVEIPVSVRDSASADLKDIERSAVRLETLDPTVNVDADASRATASLRGVEAHARRVDALSPSVSVDADTAAGSAKLAAFERRAAALDANDIDIDVDVSTAGATANLARFQGQTVATTAATSSLTRSMVGLTSPIALGGVAALAAVAVASISPLVAGLTVAGTAAVAAAGGVGLLAAAFAPAVMEIRRYVESQEEAKQAMKEAGAVAKALDTAEEQLATTKRQGAAAVAASRDAYLSSADAVEAAEDSLESARRTAAVATEDFKDAQEELNDALRDEPLRQAEATLDLADARDAATDSTRAYNEAVEKYGKNSEEATDALRAMRRAELDLKQTERDVQEVRKEGSAELTTASKQHQEAYRGQRDAAEEVEKAEKELRGAERARARASAEVSKTVREAARANKAAQAEVAAAAKDLARAQGAADKKTVVLTGSTKRLWENLKDLKPAFNQAFRGAGKDAELLGIDILKIGEKALPALGRESRENVGEMRRQFSALADELGGHEQRSLNKLLDSTSDILGDLVRAGGRFGGGLVNVLREAVPHAKDFSRYLSDISGDFLKWSRTEKARDQVQDWLKTAKPLAKETAGAFGDIAGALVGVGGKHGKDAADVIDDIGKGVAGIIEGSGPWVRDISNIIDFLRDVNRAGKPVADTLNAINVAVNKAGPSVQDAAKAVDRWWGKLPGWLKNTSRDILDELLGPFDEAYDLLVGKSIVPQTVNRIDRLWGNLPGRIKAGLKNLPSIVGEIFKDAWQAGTKWLGELAKDAGDLMGKTAKWIKNHLEDGAGWGSDALKDLRDKGSKSQKDLEGVSSAEMKKTAGWIGHHLEAGKTDGTKALGTLRDEGSKSQKKLQGNSSSSMEKTKKDSNTFLENMKSTGLDILEVFKEKGAGTMGKIPGKWLPPMGETSSKSQGYLNNLLYGMKKVIGEADLPLKPPDEFKVRTGPEIAWRTGAQHTDPTAPQAEGGHFSPEEIRRFVASASRGSGEPEAVTGPTILTGEQLSSGNREYTFITEEPAYEERNKNLYYELGARKGWLESQAAFSHAPPVEMFGKGGQWTDDISNYPQMSPWNNFVGQIAALVKKRIGSNPTTYEGHSPDMWHAIDFMQQMNAMEPGTTIANFLYGNAAAIGLDYEIFRQKIRHPGGGWSGMEDRGSGTANHFDHVHGSFLDSPGSGKVSSNATYKGGANGGGEGLDIEPFIKKYIAEVPDFGKHLPASEAEEIASSARSAIVQELRKAAGTVGGGRSGRSGPAPPGKVGEWVAAGLALADQPADWGRDMTHLAMIESGGDPRARNPVAVGGEHATGLFQTLPSTFDAYHEAGHQDIYDPEDNTGAAANYIDDRYGSPAKIPNLYNPSAYQGYTMGGIAFKPHWAKVAEDGTPEVMMPLNTQAGIEMVRFLKTLPLRGDDDDSVGHGSVEGRLRRLEEKLEEQTERIERALAGRLRVGVEDIDDGPREAIVDAAVGAQESPAGRKAQERNRARDLDRIVRKGS